MSTATTEAISDDSPVRFSARPPKLWGARQTTPITEARHLQRIVYAAAQDPKVGPVGLSALARAWTALQTSIREMRGIPLPGQLRPDLPPFKRASKGQRQRLIDVMSDASETAARMVDDEPAAETAEPETQAQPPTAPEPKRAYVPSPIPETGKTQKHARSKELDTPPEDPLQQTKTPADTDTTTKKESLSTEGP